jgi:selenocysteine lyase/cysteine desulfurase
VDSTDGKLEDYFQKFRLNICGHDSMVQTPHGKFRCIYADWTASGRCYEPIEKKIGSELSRFVANTHTETSALGHLMTAAYQKARKTVMSHVNASQDVKSRFHL